MSKVFVELDSAQQLARIHLRHKIQADAKSRARIVQAGNTKEPFIHLLRKLIARDSAYVAAEDLARNSALELELYYLLVLINSVPALFTHNTLVAEQPDMDIIQRRVIYVAVKDHWLDLLDVLETFDTSNAQRS